MSDAASGLDLLAIARRVRGAVEHDDTARLHAELARLRTAVMHRAHAEQTELEELPDPAAAVARNGQRRLLRLVTETLFESVDGGGGDHCNCLVRAAEIEVAVRRQARLEAVLLRRHAHARTGDSG